MQVVFGVDCAGVQCRANFEDELRERVPTVCRDGCRNAITGSKLEHCLARHFPEDTNIREELQPLRDIYESVCGSANESQDESNTVTFGRRLRTRKI